MDDFPRKEVWVNFVPTKITSFVWQVFSKVWETFSSRLAIWGPAHSDVTEFIHDWQGRNFRGSFRMFKLGLMHAILWGIWGERNNRILKEKERSSELLVLKVAVCFCRWVTVFVSCNQEEVRKWMGLWRIAIDPG
ncbi:hypothetical protein LINPERPRIM_LOCUS17291 [Linum perenne]